MNWTIDRKKERIKIIKNKYKKQTDLYFSSKSDFNESLYQDRCNLEHQIIEDINHLNTLISADLSSFYFILFLSEKKQIASHLTESVFSKLPPNRYHDNDYSQWRPFNTPQNTQTISTIIKECGLDSIEQIFISQELTDTDRKLLMDYNQKSVVIIDIFSIIYPGIDYIEFADTLIPVCELTTIDYYVSSHVDTIKKKYFNNQKIRIKRLKEAEVLPADIAFVFQDKVRIFKDRIILAFKKAGYVYTGVITNTSHSQNKITADLL